MNIKTEIVEDKNGWYVEFKLGKQRFALRPEYSKQAANWKQLELNRGLRALVEHQPDKIRKRSMLLPTNWFGKAE